MTGPRVNLLLADTRRAKQWQAGLRAIGVDVQVDEACGADAEKAEWQVSVAAQDAARARKWAGDVVAGRARLPRQIVLSRSGWIAMLLILATMAALLGLSIFGR